MGHAARRRAWAQKRAHGVGGRAECLSEAWLQGGEGGGDGLEALWGGSHRVKALDGERACSACLTNAENMRIGNCSSRLFLLSFLYCLVR